MWHDGWMSVRNVVVVSSLVLGGSLAFSSCSSTESSTSRPQVDVTLSNIESPTDPAMTSPPTSTIDKDVPEEGEPQTEVVNITVDTSEGGTQEAAVSLGSPVNIRVRSGSQDEFHLHGYDLELSGTDVMFSFVADRIGTYVLEAHSSGEQLLILTVFED